MIIAKLKKIGNGYFVLIPRGIRTSQEMKEGDLLIISARKLTEEEEPKMKHYHCRLCLHDFHNDDEIPYCPVCDQVETVNEVRE